jgi:hypothetical protein
VVAGLRDDISSRTRTASEIWDRCDARPDDGPCPGSGVDVLEAWAEQSRRRAAGPDHEGARFAFYGRVSTEDWQDPVTSRARQQEQAAALVAGHGMIVAEFFDVGRAGRCRGRGARRPPPWWLRWLLRTGDGTRS